MSDEPEINEPSVPTPSPGVAPGRPPTPSEEPAEEEAAPEPDPAPVKPPEQPATIPPSPPDLPEFGVEVFSRLSKDEILDALESLTVSELTDLRRRWKIVFALNGISPEFRAMTASERLQIVDAIIKSQDEAAT